MQDEVNQAWQNLLTAMANLRLKADKSLLSELVNEAEGIDLAAYTEESAAAFRTALADAKSVLADETLSRDDQDTVDAAVAKLESAEKALETKQASVSNTDTASQCGNKDDKANSSSTDNSKSSANTSSSKTTAKSAKTGDASQMAVWMILFAAAAGVCVVSRKKRQN